MESVGINLKLELKKTAVPSVFPETEAYKENRRPLNPIDLGPAKRKRECYGAFEKRNRQQIISEILHEVVEVSGSETCGTETETYSTEEDISGMVSLSDHVSQATQTDATTTENKSFQIRPTTSDMNVGPQALTQDSACGPDLSHLPVAVDKSYQFPEDNPLLESDDADMLDSDYEDDKDDDPDWRPDEWDVDMSSEDEMWAFILPAIDNVWTKRQASILEECRGRKVKAGGDARCCTPGHSAKYGSYTIMDLETGQVLAVELVQSNEVKNSNAMELEGLKRALTKLDDNDVRLSDLTTDRHVQVRKYLREERPEIKHWFDGWHLAKTYKGPPQTAHKICRLQRRSVVAILHVSPYMRPARYTSKGRLSLLFIMLSFSSALSLTFDKENLSLVFGEDQGISTRG